MTTGTRTTRLSSRPLFNHGVPTYPPDRRRPEHSGADSPLGSPESVPHTPQALKSTTPVIQGSRDTRGPQGVSDCESAAQAKSQAPKEGTDSLISSTDTPWLLQAFKRDESTFLAHRGERSPHPAYSESSEQEPLSRHLEASTLSKEKDSEAFYILQREDDDYVIVDVDSLA
ncbi:hypothetical protein K466DRAFT_583970 [Polyporus arcularius HHB13444]|uniref:Uncharacterized protein n=1 Tax=Polyporus arcularius HHB13444 TaxID=1314778 RepID=A0A5C3PM82_9APHY|nr:hypothetical protein K466DRAFT_583970 [Polyporus arcularius HHB13444]